MSNIDAEVTPISPAGFSRLQESLLRFEVAGYGPYACAVGALTNIGLTAKPRVFIVDYALDGPVFPFTDWPK